MGRGDWRRRADAGAVRASGRGPRRHRAGRCSRSSSCASGTCRCSPGDQYMAEAQNNQVREFTVQAPRGEIIDRHGQVLVDNRTALELQVKQTDLPGARRRAARAPVRPRQRGRRPAPGADPQQDPRRGEGVRRRAPATLRRDVPYDTVYYLRENQDALPGCLGASASTCATTRRARSPRTCSATSARSTRRSSRTRAIESARARATRSARRGSSTPTTASCAASTGRRRVQVDASGQPTGGQLSTREPQTRQRPRADDRRRRSSAPARTAISAQRAAGRVRRDEHPQRPALRARLEPHLRPCDLRQAAGPARRSTRRSPRRPNGAPLFDRATNGFYPTGSTFKPITALAALDSGAHRPERDHQRHRRLRRSATARCSTTPATPSTGRSTCARR